MLENALLRAIPTVLRNARMNERLTRRKKARPSITCAA
jgi:hypothetical protein